MESDSADDTRSVHDEALSGEETQPVSNKRQKTCLNEKTFDAFAMSVSSGGTWHEVKYRGNPASKRLRDEEILRRRNIDTETRASRNDMEMEVIDEEKSQELNQDPYNNFGDISVNDPPLPSVHLGCDGNAGESRDSGVAINSVPDAQAIVKYVNTSASIIKEAFVVSGTTLKARDFSDNDSSEFRKFTRYADDFSGKASIILRLPPDQTTTRRGKNEIKIWMILNELRICPLTVTMISHFSAEAEFKDFRDANHALDTIDVLGDPVKLKANLEQRFVVSKGVISDWPSSIPELWSSIQDRSKILSMERMYRRKWDSLSSKTSLVATDNIIVTFKDKNIRNLTIFDKGIVLRVRRYVPQVRQCFNCFRFGHTKLNCKSDTRCIICGDKAHGRCEREQRCYNCGGCHKSTFRGCPQFEKTKNINIVMAHKNISFHSAKRIVEREASDSSPEYQNKLTNPTSWPNLPSSAGPISYSEALRADSRVPTGPTTSAQRDKGDHPLHYSAKDKRRATYEAPRNFYKFFDFRSGEITREKRGIMFTAGCRAGSETLSKDNHMSMGHQEDHRISETIESILLLLRKVPGARIKLIRALAASEAQDEQDGGFPLHPDNIQSNEEMEYRESSRDSVLRS
ncbi:uncharacterized protein LOC112463676 [Temnothorax curvispinosus]|uniref:Uncharacterized protein LOC112463676 n=1 Tax=Temnothorax curvispinosus TaxID=300111 RepID=A0A6J1QYJ5_9HYME|nr:uncharacterized protein LOC112463676 [Temnothorax curvispinosus]